MTSFTVRCPQCDASLEMGQVHPGVLKCKCPKCAHDFEVTLSAPTTAMRSEGRDTAVDTQTTKQAPPGGKGGTGGGSKASRPPAPRPVPKTSTRRKSSAVTWFFGCGMVACLFGILAIAVIGLGIWWAKTQQPEVAELRPKDDPTKKSGLPDDAPPPPKKEKSPADAGDKKDIKKEADPKKAPDAGKKQPNSAAERPRLSNDEWEVRSRIIPFDAVGSRERLEEIHTVQIKGTAKSIEGVNEVVLAWESMRRLKHQEQGAAAGPSLTLLIREHGWSIKKGNVMTLEGDGLGFHQHFNCPTILSNLIPLTEQGFEVKAGPDRMIAETNTNCSSAIVERLGRAPITLYFSKETKLLHKTEFTVKLLDAANKPLAASTRIEFYFTRYKVVDGVNHWRTQEQRRDGKIYSLFDLSEVKFFDRSNDALFTATGLEERVRKVTDEYDLADKKDVVQRFLVVLGANPGSDFARLVQGLSHTNAELRSKARRVLIAYADLWRKGRVVPLEREDVASLVVLLKGGEVEELRSFAVAGVTKLASQASEAAPALVKMALEKQDANALAKAIVALRSTGDKSPATLAAFEKHLDHADAGVKDSATAAILVLGPERVPLNRVLALMAGTNDEVRIAAGKALRQKLATATGKDLPGLRDGLKSKVRDIQLEFIVAVGSLKEDGREALPEMTLFLASPDKELAGQAVLAIDKMGKLVDVARDDADPKIVAEALRGLRSKAAKTADALAAYQKHLDHRNVAVRDSAILALLELGPEKLKVDKLSELMASSNQEVCTGAKKLLDQNLATVTVKDLPELRNGLKSQIKDVQVSFIDAIGRLKGDGQPAAADLGALLASSDKEVSLRLIGVLENMGKGGAKAVPALEKKVESGDKTIALAATMALCKIDPTSAGLKSTGVDVLLDDLNPDANNIKAFLDRPLGHKSAAAILDLGEPAVAPVVKYLLNRNDPKKVPENQQLRATAARCMGYAFLKEFAKKAKAKDDKKLIVVLKKQEAVIKAYWEPLEARLAKQAKSAFALPPETKQLYITTADASYEAYRSVIELRP